MFNKGAFVGKKEFWPLKCCEISTMSVIKICFILSPNTTERQYFLRH